MEAVERDQPLQGCRWTPGTRETLEGMNKATEVKAELQTQLL